MPAQKASHSSTSSANGNKTRESPKSVTKCITAESLGRPTRFRNTPDLQIATVSGQNAAGHILPFSVWVVTCYRLARESCDLLVISSEPEPDHRPRVSASSFGAPVCIEPPRARAMRSARGCSLLRGVRLQLGYFPDGSLPLQSQRHKSKTGKVFIVAFLHRIAPRPWHPPEPSGRSERRNGKGRRALPEFQRRASLAAAVHTSRAVPLEWEPKRR